MTHDHEFYKMQSALAITGHLTNSELLDVEQHLAECISCRQAAIELAAVSRTLFLVQECAGNVEKPDGMHQRFIERARKEGVVLQRESCVTSQKLSLARIVTISAAFAFCFAILYRSAPLCSVVKDAVQRPLQFVKTAPPSGQSADPGRVSGEATGSSRSAGVSLVSETASKTSSKSSGGRPLRYAPWKDSGRNCRTKVLVPLRPSLRLASSERAGLIFENRSSSRRPFAAPNTSYLVNRDWSVPTQTRTFPITITLASLYHLGTSSSPEGEINDGTRFRPPVFHFGPGASR